MKEIILGKGYVALVDDEDFDVVNQYKWYAEVRKNDQIYAHRNAGQGRKNRKTERMHRFIMKAKTGETIDHINGNGLDNRKSNLRIATIGQNNANRKMSRNNKSGYKGVSAHKSGNWQVHLKVGSKRIYLGLFADKIQAAKAYNNAALEHFGEFARVNVIISK